MESLEIILDFWKNKKVLITGHTGFKGSWLTMWLLKLGAKVIGVSIDVPTTPSLFDELGLKSYSSIDQSLLLTHVIFHPVQKSLNRLIQIDYTVRIQSLTGLAGV